MSTPVLTPTLLLKGSPLSAELLDSLALLRVSTSIHAAGVVTLEFEDDGFALIDGQEFIGELLEVKIDGTSVFKGKITAVGMHDKDARPRLVLTAQDASHRLAQASGFEAYLEAKVEDIVKAIAGRHGLTARVESFGDEAQPYVVQTVTDHAMLSSLARRVGCEWFTEGDTLHFRRRPTATASLALSRDDVIATSIEYEGGRIPKEVEVVSWDAAGTAAASNGTTAVSLSAKDLHGSTASLVTGGATAGQGAFGKTLSVGAATTGARENDLVKEGIEREFLGAGLVLTATLECEVGAKAGAWITLGGYSTKLDGDYYVTEVVHQFGGGPTPTTTIRSGGHRVEAPTWAPEPGNGAWSAGGPVIGVVTNIDDDEALGRIKVRFPSLGDVESAWARIVSVGAGTRRGIDFRPEVDDEVLVAFEHGDPRFPLILGGVWNGGGATNPFGQVVEGGKAGKRGIQSRNEHALVFGDGDAGTDASFAKLHTTDEEMKVVLDESLGITIAVPDGKSITLKAGGTTLTLTDSGDIELKTASGKNIILKGNDITATAQNKATVKGTAGGVIDGGPNLEMKASGMAKLQAGGILTVKGSLVKIN